MSPAAPRPESSPGQWIFNHRLNGATRGRSTINRIGTVFGNQILCGLSELNGHTVQRQTVAQLKNHEVDNTSVALRRQLKDSCRPRGSKTLTESRP